MRVYDNETFFQDVNDDKVRIYGDAVFNGNVACRKIGVPGTAKIAGNLDCKEKLSASGNLVVNGDATTKDKLSVPGKLVVNGNLSYVRSFRLFGQMRVAGNIRAYDDLSVLGELECNGDLILDGSLKTHAKIKVDGNIMSRREVNLTTGHSIIQGDVYGYNVSVTSNTEVLGTIYYVNYISVKNTAKTNPIPKQITHEQLAYMIDSVEAGKKQREIPQIAQAVVQTNNGNQTHDDVEKPNYCPYCGEKISETTKFCPSCGMET